MMMSMTSGPNVKSRITITVDPGVLAMVRTAVDAGTAASVSAFFEWAALDVLDADAAYDRMLDEMLEATGGPLTDQEIEDAERDLGYRE